MSEGCKLVSTTKKQEGLAKAKEDILKDDGSHITSINDMVKLISEKKGGQKGGVVDLAMCTKVLAIVLCVITTGGGVWAFSVACQTHGVSLQQLEAAKDVLEKSLLGCSNIQGIAARKLAANYSPIPACSDVTLKIEYVVNEIANLMKQSPSYASFAYETATKGWTAATASASALCGGICYFQNKKGGKKSKKNKKPKKSRKQKRKTRKN